MDKRRWIVATIVAALAVTAIEWVGHGVLLSGLYQQTASVWRPMDAMSKLMPWGWASTLVSLFILVYIFHRGFEGRGSRVAEGLRFGLVIGLFQTIPMAIWTYIMLPIPASIALGWFVIGMIDMLVAGAVIALLYRKSAA